MCQDPGFLVSPSSPYSLVWFFSGLVLVLSAELCSVKSINASLRVLFCITRASFRAISYDSLSPQIIFFSANSSPVETSVAWKQSNEILYVVLSVFNAILPYTRMRSHRLR